MQVMLLAFEAPEDFAARENKASFEGYMNAWRAFGGALDRAGVLDRAAPLSHPGAATVISVKDGVRRVEDGPFSASKEQLGGFFVLRVKDMDEAVEWAAKCPAAKNGRVDIRVIPDFGQGE